MTEVLAFGVGHLEIVVILLVILLLFGTSKIPTLMRSMGSGISEFKKGIRQGEKDAEKEALEESMEARNQGDAK